jgi:hypothetical protein
MHLARHVNAAVHYSRKWYRMDVAQREKIN